MIKFIKEYVKIDTENTTLLLSIRGGDLEKLYYGKKIKDFSSYEFFSGGKVINALASVDDYDVASRLISSIGNGNNRESFVHIVDGNGGIVNRFSLEKVECLKEKFSPEGLPSSHGDSQTLAVRYIDRGVRLNVYITCFAGSDGLVFCSEIVNESGKNIHINRLCSLQMDFCENEFVVHTLDGTYAYERQKNNQKITNGVYSIESRCGSSSNKHNPFMVVEGQKSKTYYAFNLVYSGNHMEKMECNPNGTGRFLNGINDFCFNWNLANGESFSSPEAVAVFGKTQEEVTARMHQFVIEHIVAKEDLRVRPVLLNSWEAMYFSFNREKLEKLLELAQSCGMEMFVLDDGWFGSRNNDKTSLGDWFDNAEKTGGLKKLISDIHSRGLMFGLWFEPEMISVNSELFKKFPHFAMMNEGVSPLERRFQLMLDLANKEVVDYLIDVLTGFLKEYPVDYIKWDCNRAMHDIKSGDKSGEYFHRYYLGLYRLLSTLKSMFPHILFESCSAGGNRFDLGLMRYMPQTWASDNTDARDRLKIQEGGLLGYPQSCMTAHVSHSPNQQTGNATSMFDRFTIACAGVLGYELDLTGLTSEDLDAISKQTLFYKNYRELLQFGEYRLLGSAFCENECGWIVLSKDRSQAFVTLVMQSYRHGKIDPRFSLSGLDEGTLYKVSILSQAYEKEEKAFAYGDVLNEYGINLGDFFKDRGLLEQYSNSIRTVALIIEKVEE